MVHELLYELPELYFGNSTRLYFGGLVPLYFLFQFVFIYLYFGTFVIYLGRTT